jgi:putative membrane protein
MMKTPLALAAAALMLCATTACNRDHDADDAKAPVAATDTAATPADTMPATPAPADTAPAPAAAPTQQEALALLNLVNDHEVKAAEQAKSKKVTGDVAAYADMMKAEHGKNMDATKNLLDKNGGAPADTAAITDMKSKADAEIQQLAALDGDAYAKAYMDAMVMGHQDALTKLDTMLIPAATDAAVKAHLQATRDAVQKHLDKAKEIQAKLGTDKAA